MNWTFAQNCQRLESTPACSASNTCSRRDTRVVRYWTICLKIVRFCSVRGRPSVYLCKPSCFRLFPDFSSCWTRAIIILSFSTNSYCFPFNESPWNKFSSDSFVPDNWWPRNIENREFLDVGLNALEFALGKWETVIKLDVLRVPNCCRLTMLITCKDSNCNGEDTVDFLDQR